MDTVVKGQQGYTLFELLVTMGLIGIVAAIGLPVMNDAIIRNRVWTGSETIGTQIRQARLLAITHNTRFRVRFNCPAAGEVRILVVTGNATIDNSTTRCASQQTYDSGVVAMPAGVLFGTVPTLEVNGRGVYSAISGSVPLTIDVSYGSSTRSLTVNSTGQITFDTY
jgi:prepilin-type N-terminal cleavage/methylation domain-containing protein